MRESTPKAAIFDLGRVLVNYDTLKTCNALAAFTHLSAEEVHAAIFTGHGLETYRHPYETGAFPCETFFEHMRSHLHLTNLEFEEFRSQWGDIIGPPDGIHEIINRIPSRIKIGILSNIDPLNWAVAAALPLIEENFPLARCTLSFVEKCRKPNETIYLAAARRVRAAPSKTVYIDDLLENVEAAGRLGFRAEQYNCLEQPVQDLEDILRKHGVIA